MMLLLKIILFLSSLIFDVILYEDDWCYVNDKGQCLALYECSYIRKGNETSTAATIERHSKSCGRYDTTNGPRTYFCCVKPNKAYYKRKAEQKLHEKMCKTYGPPTRFMETTVVHGREAEPSEYPHMALLGYGNKNNIQWRCGGNLISRSHVLTAAHCLFDPTYKEVKYVRLGDIKKDGSSDSVENFRVAQRIRHPEYKRPAAYNDIALLKLDRTVEFTPDIKPACLHSSMNLIHNKYEISATGWGLTESGYAANILRTVNLDIFNNKECNYFYQNQKRRFPRKVLYNRQICAGGRKQPRDTCNGDSGGPLQYRNLKETHLYQIIGITSLGKDCGVTGVPAIYTRVAYYIPWIEGIAYSSSRDKQDLLYHEMYLL